MFLGVCAAWGWVAVTGPSAGVSSEIYVEKVQDSGGRRFAGERRTGERVRPERLTPPAASARDPASPASAPPSASHKAVAELAGVAEEKWGRMTPARGRCGVTGR